MAEKIIQQGDRKSPEEVIALIQKYFPNAINERIGQNNKLAVLYATFFGESSLFATVQSGFNAKNQNIDNRSGKAEPSFGLAQINADVHLSSILDKMGIDKNDTNIQNAISNTNFYDLDDATQLSVATWLSNPDNNLTMAKEIYDLQGIPAWSAYKPNDTTWQMNYQAGLTIPNFTSPTQTTPPSSKSIYELIDEAFEGAESMSADATNYEVDEINKELGITNTALGSSIKRGWERAMRGDLDAAGYIKLVEDVNEAIAEYQNPDNSLAQRAGAFLRKGAMGLGFLSRGVGALLEETFAGLFNSGADIFRAEPGGIGDAFFDALLGANQGTNSLSTWFDDNKPGYRYDSAINKWININNNKEATAEEVLNTETQTAEPETVYWARQGDSWITTTETDKPADAIWGWDLDEFNGVDKSEFEQSKYADFAALSADFPRLLSLATPEDTTTPTATITQEISRDWNTDGSNIIELNGKRYALFEKDGEFKSAGSEDEFNDILNDGFRPIGNKNSIWTDFQTTENISDDDINVLVEDTVDYETIDLYSSDKRQGTAPSQVAEAMATTADTTADAVEDEAQLVTETLNDFNNIPKNAVTIQAGEQLFLAYEVPGAYGQLYTGEPLHMIYEVLGNDLIEAGLLTQGATPNVNISLPSVDSLNQYGIIVGGTDELTDDVEHPFIRFVENFEAGKRINPWLADTSINPNTGETYQKDAITFLAEQALEQFTPEETQVRYEGSDWYQKSTTQQKTWLTTVLTQPAQAEQDIQDKQIEVKAAMEANGIASPPDALVNWVADKAVTGMWTQVYTDQQIALLADPYKPGTRDTGMVNFIEGVGVGTLDRLSVGEKTVTDLYRRYLGPSLGNASDDEIAEKAGLLRSDPDAEQQLKSYLEQQRLAMFGNYTNPTLTYNDIVQPYKNLVNQVWGQEVDETQDWFIKMVQDNDIEKAYTTLREKGMEQGIERVQDQALNDLQKSIGQGQIAPQLGANT
tara:strand:+ start:42 stop:2987 length:2946 start_codon:yes stop_codon:yes gene_type:complete